MVLKSLPRKQRQCTQLLITALLITGQIGHDWRPINVRPVNEQKPPAVQWQRLGK